MEGHELRHPGGFNDEIYPKPALPRETQSLLDEWRAVGAKFPTRERLPIEILRDPLSASGTLTIAKDAGNPAAIMDQILGHELQHPWE